MPPDDALPILVDGNDVLTLNGEVYGIPGGRPEHSSTDTQRLVTWLARGDGPAKLQTLRGLFAFCHFDGQRLLLARDRFGIKPLYYAFHRGGLVFASEMKALLALPGFSREPDVDILEAIEVVGHNVFVGRTPFRHVHALKPGHMLVASSGIDAEERPFAEPATFPLQGEGRDEQPTVVQSRVEEMLEESVHRSMNHDPRSKAIFFSGGLDSSLLLEMASKTRRVVAYVLTDREDADDLVEAREVASRLGVDLRERWLTVEELDREIVHYAWHFEHPIAGGAFDILGGVAFHALARTISHDHRVAFCGEGADELFLGYHRLHTEPELTVRSFERRLDGRDPALIREWLTEQGVFGTSSEYSSALRKLGMCEGLSEYHLPSVDRSGMAFGLEVRPPYLDEDLVEYLSGLDESVLLDRQERWTKIPLRGIARERLSPLGMDRVAVRRKRAMPAAVERIGRELAGKLVGIRTPASSDDLTPLLRDLFHYLHVEPGVTSAPDFSLSEFAAEHAGWRPDP